MSSVILMQPRYEFNAALMADVSVASMTRVTDPSSPARETVVRGSTLPTSGWRAERITPASDDSTLRTAFNMIVQSDLRTFLTLGLSL